MNILSYNDITLIDDGTLDTVFKIGDTEVRFSQEIAAPYRNSNGVLNEREFLKDFGDEIMETYDLDCEFEQNNKAPYYD